MAIILLLNIIYLLSIFVMYTSAQNRKTKWQYELPLLRIIDG